MNYCRLAIVEIIHLGLSTPSIVRLTQALGSTALKSSRTAIGDYFDAESASILSDLERLLGGAYVCTKNFLAETTRFERSSAFANLAMKNGTVTYLQGV